MQTFFRTIARRISTGIKLPLLIALLIEAISSLQILHILLKSTFKLDLSQGFAFSAFFRALTSYITVFEPDSDSQDFKGIWFGMFAYLLLLLTLFPVLVLFQFFPKTRGFNKIWTLASLISLLHSRLFFFPIQHFLIGLINNFISCEDQDDGDFSCQISWLVLTCLAIFINTAIAGFIELFLYDINKTKNAYAMKSNTFNLVVLIQKFALLLVYFLADDLEVKDPITVIIHAFFTLILLYILFFKLPYYHTTLLTLRIIITAITAATIFILLLVVCEVKEHYLEFSWTLLCLLSVKAALIARDFIIKSIFDGRFGNPEKAIHFFILLKEFNFGHLSPSVHHKSFPYKSILINGSFLKIESDSKYWKREKKEKEHEIYEKTLEKFLPLMKQYQKSTIFNLFLAQIYLKKLGNIPQALSLLAKISQRSLFFPYRNSVEEFETMVKRIYVKQYQANSDHTLNISGYFHQLEKANAIKADIQKEAQAHLNFWLELKNNNIDVSKSFAMATQVDKMTKQIQKNFKKDIDELSKVVSNSLLVYQLYLETLHGSSPDTRKLMHRFTAIRYNTIMLHQLNVYSSEKAVVVLSLQKEKFGTILNISGSAQGLFQIDRARAIGKGLDYLLPGTFAGSLAEYIQSISKVITHRINHQVKTYARSEEGDLFELEAQVRLFPELQNEVKLMVIFTRKSPGAPILVCGVDGTLLECSEEFKKRVEMGDLLAAGRTIQSVCQDFEHVNTAFNWVYGNHSNTEKFRRLIGKTSSKDGKRLAGLWGKSSLDRIKRNLSNKSSEIVIADADHANEVCEKFKEGSQVRFFNPVKQAEVELDIQVEPYVLGRHFYKIVTLRNEEIMKESWRVMSRKWEENIDQTKEPSGSTENWMFADEFPLSTEKELFKSGRPSNSLERFVKTDPSQSDLRRTPAGRFAFRVINVSARGSEFSMVASIPGEGKTAKPNDFFGAAMKTESMVAVDDAKDKELSSSMEAVRPDLIKQAKSVTSLATTGAHAIKFLRQTFSQKKSYPLARKIFYIAGLLVLIMVILSVVFYTFSETSISDYDRNIKIINGATRRVAYAMGALQLVSRFYLNTTGLGMDDIGNIRADISSQALQMLQYNNLLDEQLSKLLDADGFHEVYSNDVELWEPCQGVTSNNDFITTFRASSMLYNRFHSLRDVPKSCQDIDAPDDLLYAINNTANDFLQSSEKLMTTTKSVLESSVDQNILNLWMILVGESLVLAILCVVFGVAIYYLLQSYHRLFHVLVKIDPSHVDSKVHQIQRLKTFLDNDIEGKKILAEASDAVHEGWFVARTITVAKHRKQSDENKFHLKNIKRILAKNMCWSIVFIALPSILFYSSLMASINDFGKLDKLDDQLVLASRMQYQVDLLMSNFYIEMLFRNETSIQIRDELPRVQLLKNLDNMNSLHQEVMETFFGGDDYYDPLLDGILTDNLCNSTVDSSAKFMRNCEKATSGLNQGLIGTELSYISNSKFYIDQYLANPTFHNADMIVEPYSETIRPILETLITVFSFIDTHLLAACEVIIERFESRQTQFFAGILVTILFSGVITYYFSVRKFRSVDMGRGKILMMIPYNIIIETRALDLYLKKDFSFKKFGLRTMHG